MALYGAVPFMLAHGNGQTSGFLWLNAAETFIDVSTQTVLGVEVWEVGW